MVNRSLPRTATAAAKYEPIAGKSGMFCGQNSAMERLFSGLAQILDKLYFFQLLENLRQICAKTSSARKRGIQRLLVAFRACGIICRRGSGCHVLFAANGFLARPRADPVAERLVARASGKPSRRIRCYLGRIGDRRRSSPILRPTARRLHGGFPCCDRARQPRSGGGEDALRVLDEEYQAKRRRIGKRRAIGWIDRGGLAEHAHAGRSHYTLARSVAAQRSQTRLERSRFKLDRFGF